MDPQSLFGICNLAAMVGWLILILSRYIKIADIIIQKGVIPILLSLVYLYLIIGYFGSGDGGFGSIEEVRQLFQSDHALLAGWVHYLAFDLWLGCWELGDARKNGVPHLLLIPCFFLTFMFGPIGLLTYLLIRTIITKKAFIYDHFRFSQGA